jgi:hypothetical protein
MNLFKRSNPDEHLRVLLEPCQCLLCGTFSQFSHHGAMVSCPCVCFTNSLIHIFLPLIWFVRQCICSILWQGHLRRSSMNYSPRHDLKYRWERQAIFIDLYSLFYYLVVHWAYSRTAICSWLATSSDWLCYHNTLHVTAGLYYKLVMHFPYGSTSDMNFQAVGVRRRVPITQRPH